MSHPLDPENLAPAIQDLSDAIDRDLISEAYRQQLLKMRSEKKPNWGNGGKRHVERIVQLIVQHRIKSVVDYGCGHGVILSALAEQFGEKAPELNGYDPGIPERSALPVPSEMLISTDVLEHIEPDRLDGVLTHIRFLTARLAYINVHTSKANAILPDGRNAHLIQQPAAWWKAKLEQYFRKVDMIEGGLRPTFVCE